jgi:predicted RNA methylase
VTKQSDLDLNSHFSFGDNWAQYSKYVTDEHLKHAVDDLKRLLGVSTLNGKTFCDIGCGSGIHSVAAAKMGAMVTAVDIDPMSTATAIALAQKFGVSNQLTISNYSIFDHKLPLNDFNIVYSWGVLHHTGAMWNAIEEAMKLVSPASGSIFAIALYRKTRLCSFWKFEKRLYKDSPRFIQAGLRILMTALMDVANLLRLKSPIKFRSEYQMKRGMSFKHDVHDWLGGYPYESVQDNELKSFFSDREFVLERTFLRSPNKMQLGIFGSGCDEYVFKKA